MRRIRTGPNEKNYFYVTKRILKKQKFVIVLFFHSFYIQKNSSRNYFIFVSHFNRTKTPLYYFNITEIVTEDVEENVFSLTVICMRKYILFLINKSVFYVFTV